MDTIHYVAPQNARDHINRYNNVHFPLSKVLKQKAWKKSSNASFNQKLMNNNAKMRKHHKIKQPGFDVQRKMKK